MTLLFGAPLTVEATAPISGDSAPGIFGVTLLDLGDQGVTVFGNLYE